MRIPKVSEVFNIPPVSEVLAAIFTARGQAEPEPGQGGDGPCGRPYGRLEYPGDQAHPEPESRVMAEPELEAEP
jgi:hypothetical protein